MLSQDEIKFYKKNGYLLVTGLINHDLINNVLNTVLGLISKYDSKEKKGVLKITSWEDEKLHKIMIRLRQQNPKIFSAIYDATRLSIATYKLLHESKTVNCIEQLLNQPQSGICSRAIFVRMDPPNDKRSSYGWHQDGSYTDFNTIGDNALATWIPLTHNSEINGSLKICEGGSHKQGKIETNEFREEQNFVRQFPVPDKFIDKYKIINIDVSPGDILFIHMHLIHRSGKNVSSKIRFTATTRFHSMLTDDFFIKI